VDLPFINTRDMKCYLHAISFVLFTADDGIATGGNGVKKVLPSIFAMAN